VRFHHTSRFMKKQKDTVRLRLPPDHTRSFGIIDSKQQLQQNQLCCLSTQLVSFSRHLISRRDARVDKPMPKEQLVGKVTSKMQVYVH